MPHQDYQHLILISTRFIIIIIIISILVMLFLEKHKCCSGIHLLHCILAAPWLPYYIKTKHVVAIAGPRLQGGTCSFLETLRLLTEKQELEDNSPKPTGSSMKHC